MGASSKFHHRRVALFSAKGHIGRRGHFVMYLLGGVSSNYPALAPAAIQIGVAGYQANGPMFRFLTSWKALLFVGMALLTLAFLIRVLMQVWWG